MNSCLVVLCSNSRLQNKMCNSLPDPRSPSVGWDHVCRNNAPDITAEDIEISTRSYDSRGRSNNAPMSAIVAPSGKHKSRAGTVGQKERNKVGPKRRYISYNRRHNRIFPPSSLVPSIRPAKLRVLAWNFTALRTARRELWCCQGQRSWKS